MGSEKALEDLKSFFKSVQFVTFENEFINADLINEARKDFPKLFVLPDLKSIQVLQNKLFQKFEFKKLDLPTSDFLAYQPELDQLEPWLKAVYTKLGKCVLKWSFGGYDGKGNFVFKSINDLEGAKLFCQKALANSSTVYAEKFISFKSEVAQVFTRSITGEFTSYPLVVSEQLDNVCKLVYGPATEFDIVKDIEEQTKNIGLKIANSLNYIGTFAIEFFIEETSQVLINEMAPRVHNSGHYTLDACRDNQFSQHIRAILGAKLSPPITYPYFAMLNLLGPKDLSKKIALDVEKYFPTSEDYKIYWYGKSEVKPMRKMGHINTIALTKEDLKRKIKLMQEIENKIWSLV
jgi:phosphoribosylaminoimidazole carboxylase PurK protein